MSGRRDSSDRHSGCTSPIIPGQSSRRTTPRSALPPVRYRTIASPGAAAGLGSATHNTGAAEREPHSSGGDCGIPTRGDGGSAAGDVTASSPCDPQSDLHVDCSDSDDEFTLEPPVRKAGYQRGKHTTRRLGRSSSRESLQSTPRSDVGTSFLDVDVEGSDIVSDKHNFDPISDNDSHSMGESFTGDKDLFQGDDESLGDNYNPEKFAGEDGIEVGDTVSNTAPSNPPPTSRPKGKARAGFVEVRSIPARYQDMTQDALRKLCTLRSIPGQSKTTDRIKMAALLEKQDQSRLRPSPYTGDMRVKGEFDSSCAAYIRI